MWVLGSLDLTLSEVVRAARGAEKVVSGAVRAVGRWPAGWGARRGVAPLPTLASCRPPGPGLAPPSLEGGGVGLLEDGGFWMALGRLGSATFLLAGTGEDGLESVRSAWLCRGVLGADGNLVWPAPW